MSTANGALAAAPAVSNPVSSWEVFDVRLNGRGAESVRLGKNGQLVIGAAFASVFGSSERVELRWDSLGHRIGIVAASGAHGAKLTRCLKNRQLRVSLLGLLTHYGLAPPPKSLGIAATVEDGVLIVPVGDLGA